MTENRPPNEPSEGFQQQPGYQQQPPPGYYQQAPPKKSHTLRNVLLVIALILVLLVAGCFALIGGAANEVDKAIKKGQANDRPEVVKVGEAFTHDGYKVDSGWKLGKDFGTATINGLHITNTQAGDGGSGRTAFLTFRLYKGTENLAEITCDGKELQKGESSGMNCSSMDKLPSRFETIKVADAF